jgi:hypothetical protein
MGREQEGGKTEGGKTEEIGFGVREATFLAMIKPSQLPAFAPSRLPHLFP